MQSAMQSAMQWSWVRLGSLPSLRRIGSVCRRVATSTQSCCNGFQIGAFHSCVAVLWASDKRGCARDVSTCEPCNAQGRDLVMSHDS